MRKRLFVVAALAFIAGLMLGAASIAVAQDPRMQIFKPPKQPTVMVPKGLGEAPAPIQTEVSFRVTGKQYGHVVGRLMAKVDGNWVEVQLAPQDAYVRSK